MERQLPRNQTLSNIWSKGIQVGLALAAAMLTAGVAVQVVALVPIRVGNVEWEFGTIGEIAATGPLLLIGVAAMLFVATLARRRLLLVLVAGLSIIWACGLIGGLLLLALDVPLILRAADQMQADGARSVKVVMVKTGALLGIEAGALLILGILGFQWSAVVNRISTMRAG